MSNLYLCVSQSENKVPYVPDPGKVAAYVPHPDASAFYLGLAARSVTIISGRDQFPLSPQDAGRVLLAGNFTDFFVAGRRAYPQAISYWYSPARGADQLLALARNADTVIFSVSNRAGERMLQQLRPLAANRRMIAFSVLNPVYLDDLHWVDGALAVYSYATESFIAGFSAMVGRIPANGRPPMMSPYSLRALRENAP